MLNDTCADCTALPSIVNVPGPQGLAGSAIQTGQVQLSSGVATVSNLTINSTSVVMLQKITNSTTTTSFQGVPVVTAKNIGVANGSSPGSFSFSSYIYGGTIGGTLTQSTTTVTVTTPFAHGLVSGSVVAISGTSASAVCSGSITYSSSTVFTITSTTSATISSAVSCVIEILQSVAGSDNSVYNYAVIG
ncbi:MAG: hypothetical protein WCI55_08110 [Armatimonadota bacterium]